MRQVVVGTLALLSVLSLDRSARCEQIASSYRPAIWVTYRPEGDFPATQVDYLVAVPSGKAIFEQSADGSGVLLDIHWEDDHGDHYAASERYKEAIEVLVPRDSTKPAYRFVYPWGRYAVLTVDGVERPVARIVTEARARLWPAGQKFRVPIKRPTGNRA